MLESSGDWYDNALYRQDEQKFLDDLRDKIFAQVVADKGYGTVEEFNRTYAYTTDALDTFIESIKGKSEKEPDGKGASTETPSGTKGNDGPVVGETLTQEDFKTYNIPGRYVEGTTFAANPNGNGIDIKKARR